MTAQTFFPSINARTDWYQQRQVGGRKRQENGLGFTATSLRVIQAAAIKGMMMRFWQPTWY